MTRCHHCGTLQATTLADCQRCGESLIPIEARVPPPRELPPPGQPPAHALVPMPVPSTLARSGNPVPGRLPPTSREMPGTVTGRIIALESPMHEDPETDINRVITRSIWLFLFLSAPVLVIWWLLVMAGVLPAMLALGALFLLIRFLSPTNLLSVLRIYSLLRPAANPNPRGVPVRYFRLRLEPGGEEAIVRIKGEFTAGSLGLDDRVTIQGEWRQGVLFARRAFNHLPAAWVHIRGSRSWIGLCLTLVFLGLLLLLFEKPILALRENLEGFFSP